MSFFHTNLMDAKKCQGKNTNWGRGTKKKENE